MIWNLFKTTNLFAILTGILLAASYVVGISPIMALGLATLLNIGLYRFSDRMVLDQIEKSVAHRHIHGNPAFSQLYFVNPFRRSSLVELFSTHPPTWKRIARLQRFTNQESSQFHMS